MIAVALRVALLLLAAGGAAWALRRRSASMRAALWTAALAVSLALPLLPRVEVAVPVADAPVWRAASAPSRLPEPIDTRPALRPGTVPATPGWSFDPASVVWSVYLVGVGISALGTILALGRAARLARESRPCPQRIQEAARRIAAERGMRRAPRVAFGPDGVPPLMAGVLHPTILLPEAARGWDDDRLDRVLRHEVAHAERGDAFALVLARVACAVYWCHPLVPLAARQLRQECERAADDVALSGRTRPSDYAEELLAWSGRPAAPAATLPMVRRSGLAARLRHVLDARADRRRASGRARLGLLILALALGGLLPAVRAEVVAAVSVITVKSVPPGPSEFRLPNGSTLTLLGLVGVGPDGKARKWGLDGHPSPIDAPVLKRYVDLYVRQNPSSGRPYFGVAYAIRDVDPAPDMQPSGGVLTTDGVRLSYGAVLDYDHGRGRYLEFGTRPIGQLRGDLTFPVATGRYQPVAEKPVDGSAVRVVTTEEAFAATRVDLGGRPVLCLRWDRLSGDDRWECRFALRLPSGRLVHADTQMTDDTHDYAEFSVSPGTRGGTLVVERRRRYVLKMRNVSLAPVGG